MKHRHFIEKYRYILATILILVLVFIIIQRDGFGIKEIISNAKNQATRPTQFELEDRCGPVMNTVSHSIPNEDMCENMCRARCISEELSYNKYTFESKVPACNKCMCYCKQ